MVCAFPLNGFYKEGQTCEVQVVSSGGHMGRVWTHFPGVGREEAINKQNVPT